MILCACIHDVDCNIYYPGLRHQEIVKEIIDEIRDFPTNIRWGFLNEEGEFLDRRDALRIAVICGQYGQGEEAVCDGKQLFSQDIY